MIEYFSLDDSEVRASGMSSCKNLLCSHFMQSFAHCFSQCMAACIHARAEMVGCDVLWVMYGLGIKHGPYVPCHLRMMALQNCAKALTQQFQIMSISCRAPTWSSHRTMQVPALFCGKLCWAFPCSVRVRVQPLQGGATGHCWELKC